MTVSGAVIRRVDRPADRFTIVSNEFTRDMRLSFAARGLGLWLLSHADGFEITSTSIARQSGVGRDSVRRWLAELEHYRYLRRVRLRGDGGRLGAMVYEVRCSPFPPDPEEENPRSHQRLDGQALVDQAPVSAHHKKTSPKDNSTKKDQPSGGSAAADTSTPEEEPMPQRTSDQPALFEVARTEPRQQGKTAAQAIVAAFVDSHRQAHGSDPGRGEIGRVARDAANLLRTSPVERLVAAATAMGRTPYANLGVQLKIVNRTASVDKGRAPAHPHGASEWSRGAEAVHADAQAVLESSPELAAWMAGQAATA